MGDAIGSGCLVVDDEAAFRFLLGAILEDAGHRCRAAADVEEARALLAAEPAGCVLLDVSLPGEGGMAFLRELGRDRPEIAVIMVTGHHDPELARSAAAAGARGFVSKPFRAADIRAAVERALTSPSSGS
jgi:DNA-binding NtrC family response regulator